MKIHRIATGAEPCNIDLIRRQTRADQLTSVRFDQIDGFQSRRFWKQIRELLCYLGTDLKTTTSNTGSDRREEVSRAAPVLPRQPVYGSRDDVGEGSPPSGMNCSNAAENRIREQNWYTIGGSDPDGKIRLLSDNGVCLGQVAGRVEPENAHYCP